MFPIINIGPLSIATAPLLLLLGLVSGSYLMNSHAKKLSDDANFLDNLLMFIVVGGLISARIGFVIRYWQSFTSNPLLAFKLSATMLDYDFGFICALIIGLVYIQKKKFEIWKALDYLSVGLIGFMPFYYLSQLLSGNNVGKVSSLPWSIFAAGMSRHPVQIYLAISSIFIIIILFRMTNSLNKRMFVNSGYQFLFLVSLSAFYFLVLDIFYDNSILIFKVIHKNQFYALITIIICFLIFVNQSKNKRKKRIIKFSEGKVNGD